MVLRYSVFMHVAVMIILFYITVVFDSDFNPFNSASVLI